MNEIAIQNALWRDIYKAHSLVMPNYTPRGWWECDLFAVTKAGFWTEHEIKVSVADFKADALKERNVWPKFEKETKHSLLAARHQEGPTRFWFVVPDTIASKIEVPEWAGLKTVRPHDRLKSHLVILQEKPAPRLHNHKAENHKGIKDAFYWRFWHLRTRLAVAVERELKRIKEAA